MRIDAFWPAGAKNKTPCCPPSTSLPHNTNVTENTHNTSKIHSHLQISQAHSGSSCTHLFQDSLQPKVFRPLLSLYRTQSINKLTYPVNKLKSAEVVTVVVRPVLIRLRVKRVVKRPEDFPKYLGTWGPPPRTQGPGPVLLPFISVPRKEVIDAGCGEAQRLLPLLLSGSHS